MNSYIISYDLARPGQDYTNLITAIMASHSWCKIHQSVWAIQTSESASGIYRRLSIAMDSNDKLFVCNLGSDAVWNGLPIAVTQWLKAKLAA